MTGKIGEFISEREYFKRKLEPVKQRLPKNYGVFYEKEFNESPRPKVYNVYNNITVDWEVLKRLKVIARKYGVKTKVVA
jgi:hypothetical protein